MSRKKRDGITSMDRSEVDVIQDDPIDIADPQQIANALELRRIVDEALSSNSPRSPIMTDVLHGVAKKLDVLFPRVSGPAN